MQASQVFDRHAESLDHGGRDLLGLGAQIAARVGEGDGEVAFVVAVPLPAQVADRFQAFEQGRQGAGIELEKNTQPAYG